MTQHSAMEEPQTEALLEAARTTLLQRVVPGLAGDAKFQALMVANAIAIALRALQHGPVPPLEDEAALAAAIRAGHHDDDPALAALLRTHTGLRQRISSKPAR